MRIILEPNQPPKIDGEWTVGSILAAAEFLRRWVEQQQIAIQQPPAPAREMPNVEETR